MKNRNDMDELEQELFLEVFLIDPLRFNAYNHFILWDCPARWDMFGTFYEYSDGIQLYE